ncbi:MAG: DUF2281 domain-containing protein [Ignavibacteria bacterium]|nr:DUF2281 domain-containing protein [Ignavibacteria bacterium]
MIKLHISKIKNKILLPQEEFYKIVEQAKKNEEVIIQSDELIDLTDATSSSLDFWKNEVDDKIWNDA